MILAEVLDFTALFELMGSGNMCSMVLSGSTASRFPFKE